MMDANTQIISKDSALVPSLIIDDIQLNPISAAPEHGRLNAAQLLMALMVILLRSMLAMLTPVIGLRKKLRSGLMVIVEHLLRDGGIALYHLAMKSSLIHPTPP